MRDRLPRRVIKLVARAVTTANVAATRAILRLRGAPAYELGGACGRCGACCEAPSIQMGRAVWHFPLLRRAVLAYHRHVNGFELARADARLRVFTFRCTHFDPVARTCDSYASRPAMCRDYPRNLLYHPAPDFLPGCGFCALHRRRDRVAALLDAEALPPERRAAVERALFLSAPGAPSSSPEGTTSPSGATAAAAAKPPPSAPTATSSPPAPATPLPPAAPSRPPSPSPPS